MEAPPTVVSVSGKELLSGDEEGEGGEVDWVKLGLGRGGVGGGDGVLVFPPPSLHSGGSRA